MAAYKYFFGILAMALIAEMAVGTDHTVGAPGSWDLVTKLTAWTSTQKFVVNDNLILYAVFKYSPSQHNVFEVTKSNYESCGLNSPIKTYKSGDDTIALSSEGTRYFICGFPTHCTSGMKVQIDVVAASTPTPASPTPMSGPSTPAAMPPPPPPTGGSNVQAKAAGGVGFGLGMLMLLAF